MVSNNSSVVKIKNIPMECIKIVFDVIIVSSVGEVEEMFQWMGFFGGQPMHLLVKLYGYLEPILVE